MTWTKISDDYSDDCWKLSHGAFRLHTEALIWSNRKLLDGVIPIDDLRRFARDPDQAYIDELVSQGYWRIPGTQIILRHHIGYQETKAEVIARQKRNQANGRKGGRPKTREQAADLTNRTESISHSDTESVSHSLAHDETQEDGKGRANEDQPPSKPNGYGIGNCAVCGGFEKLGPEGLCSPCFVAAAVEAAS